VWALEPVLLLVFRVLTNSKNKLISSNLSFVIPFNQIHDRAIGFKSQQPRGCWLRTKKPNQLLLSVIILAYFKKSVFQRLTCLPIFAI
jgi:hypothetical protein